METIYKYPIPMLSTIEPLASFTLDLPGGAGFLTADDQGRIGPQMWFRVDPSQPTVTREFFVAGTGRTLPNAQWLMWCATFQMLGGSLVWHLFEVLVREPSASWPADTVALGEGPVSR